MAMELSDADFHRLTNFIQKNYGIDLTKKRQLIVSRLSHTLNTMGYTSFTAFIDYLMKTMRSEDVELIINKLTTNYTYFMREQAHFTFFQNTILPQLVKKHEHDRVFSIWSAGCSSGEEPYTISMYIKEFLGAKASQWDTRILATDISQQALNKAKTGIYELPDTIPPEWRRKFFVPDAQSGLHRVAPVIRDNVIFQTFNLMQPIRFQTKFDVIFCRNVMIYFDQATKDALGTRFYDATVPGGYLLVSHSETVSRSIGYHFAAPSTFRKPSV